MIAATRKVLNATTLLMCLLMVHGAASGSLLNGLVIFGDSLTDTGNNAFVFDNIIGPPAPPGTLRTRAPIATPDFVPTFPYASNRYSNGPVWPEPFAALLGAHLGINLDAGALPALLGGSNFAFGAARMGPPGATFPLNVADQVALYLTQTGGSASPTTLYVVQGGGNDARDALLVAAGGGDPSPFISSYAANTVAIVAQLYAAGAEHFLLLNVPDVGLAPAVRALGPTAIMAGTQVAKAMNISLETTLGALSPALLDGVRGFDVFQYLNDVVNAPSAFGFTDVDSACAFDPACIANPATTFFWDGIHPTAAAHAAIARGAFAALVRADIPEPPIVMLVALALFGLLRMGGAGERRAIGL
jgi:outer membrane lipase/esterase